MDLRVFSSDRLTVVQQLEKGQADLVIGSFNELPAGIRRARFLREDEVITVRTGHPLTCGNITVGRLAEFPHVVVGVGNAENGTNGFSDGQTSGHGVSIERALHEIQYGRSGPAAIFVPHFAAVVLFLQLSDMVAILPRRLALWAAAHTPLALLDPPYKSVTVAASPSETLLASSKRPRR